MLDAGTEEDIYANGDNVTFDIADHRSNIENFGIIGFEFRIQAAAKIRGTDHGDVAVNVLADAAAMVGFVAVKAYRDGETNCGEAGAIILMATYLLVGDIPVNFDWDN